MFGIVIEHGGADAVGAQQTRDDVSEPPDSGQDHGVVVLVDFIRLALGNAAEVTRLHQAIVEREEQRRGRHRNRDGGDEEIRDLGSEDAVLRRERAEDERELAALREREGEEKALAGFQPKCPRQSQKDRELQRQQTEHKQRDRARLPHDEREIDARAHRDKKETEQQTFEGLDIGFELVPILAIRENDAREEGAERRGKADLLHQERDPDHEQKCGGGKHLAQMRGGDVTQEWPEQKTSRKNHARDRGEDE